MSPRFSLIIVTMAGREQLLDACLASINDQRFKDFEAIIVDQADSPRTKSAVAGYPWARYVAAPPDGLSASRNVGLRHARGVLVAFPDDDATLAPDMLERADGIFRTHSNLGLLSGSAIDPRTQRRIFRFPGSPSALSIWNVMQRHCATTIIIDRAALEGQAHAFDPLLGVGTATVFGGSEETDLVLRLLLSGVVGRYEPDVVLYHPNSDLISSPRQKAVSYGLGLGACFRKVRERFGWWPVGGLWLWVLTRATAGILVDALLGRPAHAAQRVASLQARLRGWRLYGQWLATTGGLR
jgi:glycosyltransferase involved in cell wall biosynthesis